MEIETATRTILKKNPAIKNKELLPKVKKMTGKGRTAITDEWASMELRGKLYREKGHYWLEKPSQPQKVSFLSKWMAQRQEREDKESRRLDCEVAILLEEFDLGFSGELTENDPEYFRKKNKIRLKYLKKYKLIP